MANRYATAEAFKQALEQRLRSLSTTGVGFARRRQMLVFDRFLARVVHVLGDGVMLKGGLVLEFRLERARTTKDIDLRLVGRSDGVLQNLQAAGRLDLGDYMTFEVQPDTEHPDIQNDGMRDDGVRHRVEARLAGKIYGQPFGVDVAFADPVLGEPDVIATEDILAFAGVTAPTLRVYPVETHVAEKLHAYTLPRTRPNSRVKDLPDLALLGSVRELSAALLRAAIEQTFSFRQTHPVPREVPSPPMTWAPTYSAMAAADHLPWPTLDAVTEAVRAFLAPVLTHSHDSRWSPKLWRWDAITP